MTDVPQTPHTSIADPIRSELAPGEQVLWSGRPLQGVVVRGSDAFAIPFSVLWAGFAVFWLCGAAVSGAPLPFVLFGVPFVAVGAYMVLGRFFVEARRRAATHYAVTSQRVLIVSGLMARTVKSLDLRSITELALSERGDGSGTITFGPQHPFAFLFGGMSSWPGAERQLGPRFDLVPGARGIYETIRKAQTLAR